MSQLIAKTSLKQRSLNQIRDCLTRHNQIWHHFLIKKHWSILMTFKLRFLSFMITVNQCKWNKIKHFSMVHIQIWQCIFLYPKILKNSNDLQNQNFSVSWLKWPQTIEMKQNQRHFHGTYWNLTLFFIGRKVLKYFNDFCNRQFSIL